MDLSSGYLLLEEETELMRLGIYWHALGVAP